MSTSLLRRIAPRVFACAFATSFACRSHDAHTTVAEPQIEAKVPSTAAPTDEFETMLAGLGVRLRLDMQSVEVDGRVNMRTGPIELFACAPSGKLHESVVVLDCVPSGLQAGLLALGLEPGSPVVLGAGGEFRPPTGALVDIELRWSDHSGAEQSARAEDWIWDEIRGAAMERAPWIFAGSIEQPSLEQPGLVTFAADAVKSLVVTYHDASSLLENPHAAAIDDAAYAANQRAVPAVGTPLVAIFRRASIGGEQ